MRNGLTNKERNANEKETDYTASCDAESEFLIFTVVS